MDLMEVGWENTDWVHVSQDGNQWQASVNTVIINLRVLWKAGYFLA